MISQATSIQDVSNITHTQYEQKVLAEGQATSPTVHDRPIYQGAPLIPTFFEFIQFDPESQRNGIHKRKVREWTKKHPTKKVRKITKTWNRKDTFIPLKSSGEKTFLFSSPHPSLSSLYVPPIASKTPELMPQKLENEKEHFGSSQEAFFLEESFQQLLHIQEDIDGSSEPEGSDCHEIVESFKMRCNV